MEFFPQEDNNGLQVQWAGIEESISQEPPTGVCDIKVQVFIKWSNVVATTSLDRPHASDDARDAAIFMSCVL
jgi:hypothetical protein